MPLEATLHVSQETRLPLAKLCLSGSVEDLSDDSKQETSQRAVVFVIDISGSMSGTRINNVKSALVPFISDICEDTNTFVKLILFCHEAESYDIPRNRDQCKQFLETTIQSRGATDFLVASKELVKCSQDILDNQPNHQLSLIMCSDGQVSKQNATSGHKHWKQWVFDNYMKKHNVVPFVSTVGISASHDADILDGFICDDNAGNYVFCSNSESIIEAFNDAGNQTMLRNARKINIKFPFNKTLDSVYSYMMAEMKETDNQSGGYSSEYELIIGTGSGDYFTQNYWVSMAEVNDILKSNKQSKLFVQVEDKQVEINVISLDDMKSDMKEDDDQSQTFSIDFYNQMLKDMLGKLRGIQDMNNLKLEATKMNGILEKYQKQFDNMVSEPKDKTIMQEKIKALLQIGMDKNDGKEMESEVKQNVNDEGLVEERRKLLKEYKNLSKIWKMHRQKVIPFQTSLNALKSLINEIMIGQLRVQEIRQHILDLHYKKKHEKRIESLILSDEQLQARQEWYLQTVKKHLPTEKECKNLSNERGSGCFLSTLTLKEVVMEGDPLWVCGRVSREGGAMVSNPELMLIQYISPDLVSDSYFQLAIEASPNGFADSSRQLINARLFPIYGNYKHFLCTKPYLNEALSHALSGRVDIKLVDFGCLFKFIGFLISFNSKYLTQFWLERLFKQILPSMLVLCKNHKVRPFASKFSREPGDGPKITMLEQSKQRLKNYLESFEARTTALVSCSEVLYCDKLLQMVTHDKKGQRLELDNEFWMSQVLQRLRQCVRTQLPGGNDDDGLMKERQMIHDRCLQLVVRGLTSLKLEENEEKNVMNELSDLEKVLNEKKMNKTPAYGKIFSLPYPLSSDAYVARYEDGLGKYDPNQVDSLMVSMVGQILGYVEVRGFIQACQFLSKLESESKQKSICSTLEDDLKTEMKSEETSETVLKLKEYSKSDMVNYSALCIIPPKSLWDPIQTIRKKFDKAYPRWMPHLNILYPFISEDNFTSEMENIKSKLSNITKFDVTLDHFSYFRKEATNSDPNPSQTVFLECNILANEQFSNIFDELIELYPACMTKKNQVKFTAHLTVGQWPLNEVDNVIKQYNSQWKPLNFECNNVCLIARPRDGSNGPFEVKHNIPLGLNKDGIGGDNNSVNNISDGLDVFNYDLNNFKGDKFNLVDYNDILQFFKVVKFDFNKNVNVLRAMIGIALVTGINNKQYRGNLAIFGDNDKKQILNDPDSVLSELNRMFVEPNIRHEFSGWLEAKERLRLMEIHSGLPDNVDKYGNLPRLTCAWSKCGIEFDNRDRLLNHVEKCRNKKLVHRFHLWCREILEDNLEQTMEEFIKKARVKFDGKLDRIGDDKFELFYKQFVPILKSLE